MNSAVFEKYPSLQIIHHKSGSLKGTHISYVTRTNPLPQYLEEAVIQNFEKYGFEYKPEMRLEKIDLRSLFKNPGNKLVVEIGFGEGGNSFRIAEKNPDVNYFAFDVFLYGFASYMKKIADAKLDNVLLCRYDAEDFIVHSVAPVSIDGFNIFFPDPWPKHKQQKRRIVNEKFVSVLSKCLTKGGIIHLATDVEEYALHMLKVLSAEKALKNRYECFAPERQDRFETVFENRGIRENRRSFDIIFEKK